MNKILVVVAHPDDEVLGCGGTIVKHVESGDTVHCLILSDGVSSRMDPKNHIVSETQKLIDNRRLEARKCAEILGIEKLYFDYYGDQMFNAIPQLSMNRAIEKVVYKFVPDIVYTHTEHDLNLDHVMVSQSCQVACRGVNKLYAFEITGSQKFFNPSVFVELTLKQHLTKLEGLEAYKSELKEYPHPRSGLAVETLSRLRGITIGVHYAEAFECIKVIK